MPKTGTGKAKYITLLNRASKVTFRKEYHELSTIDEKRYIKLGVDRMLAGDRSRGGYSGKYERYIRYGGRLPALPK